MSHRAPSLRPRPRLLAVLAAAFVLLVSGVVLPAAAAHADDGTATITVNVLDGDNSNSPVSSMDLDLFSSTGSWPDFYSVVGTTDGSGAYPFAEVPPGSYYVQAQTSNDGTWASSAQQLVTVAANDSTSVDLTLFHATASLNGTVTDSAAKPLNASIAVVPNNAGLATVQSNTDAESGAYVVPDPNNPMFSNKLAAGDYEVTVSSYGYLDQSENVTLAADEDLLLNFVLTLAPRLSGVVKDKKTGLPLAGIGVDLLCGTDPENLVGQDPLGVAGETDATGTWEIPITTALTHCTVLFRDLNPRDSEYPGPSVVHESAYLGGVQDPADATYFDVPTGSPISGKNISLGLGATLNLSTFVQTLDGRVGLDAGFWGFAPTVYFAKGSEWLPYSLQDQQFAGADGVPRGTVQLYGVAPGKYRIGWIAGDGSLTPWVPQFWNGAADEDSATPITVTVSATATKSPIANIGPVILHYTQPDTTPGFVDESTLTPVNENEGLIADPDLTQGQDTSVDIGDEYAGQWVYVTANSDSTPVSEGWVQVNKSGEVPVAIGYDTAAGSHKLAVQTADGSVLGWANLNVSEATSHHTFTTTPAPKITGTPAVGATLTAVPAAWTPVVVQSTYQWQADGVDIADATGATFTPTTDEFGEKISVEVTGHRIGVDDATVASLQTATVGLGTLHTATPTVTGVRAVGGILTASAGTWSPASPTFTYQWLSGGKAISGATGPTYQLTTADYQHVITVAVTGTATDYAPTAVTSSSTVAKVAAGTLSTPALVLTSVLPVVGTPDHSVVIGTWGPSPVTVSYQWAANGVAIAGATSATYTPSAGDLGKTLTITVTGNEPAYATARLTSTPAAAVIYGHFVVTTPPTLGIAQRGIAVPVVVGNWLPTTATVTYRWFVGGIELPDSATSVFVPTASQVGKSLRLGVVLHRPGYVSKVVLSQSTVIHPR